MDREALKDRRKAVGVLTNIAILERELGGVEHQRFDLERRLARKPAAAEATRLRAELVALQDRRAHLLKALDDEHARQAKRDD